MKKLRITKTVKVLLAAIITFTSVGLFNLTVNADNEFDIQESVTYSEDNSEATITLDIASIGEDYVLEEVKNPDGTVMDLTNLNYIVTENKTYEFNISYFDKENIRQEYIKEIEVDGIKIIDRSGLARATDYTSQVEILDFDILDRNGVPLSETNEASNGGSYQLVVDWTLSPSGGLTLQAGDTFSIPLPKNEIKGAWSALTSEYVNFTDSTGTIVLGQWKIENGRIIVVLGSEASNSHIINGKMITGTNTVHVNNVQGITQNVTMGTISKVIKFKTTVLNESSTADTKSANSVSNNSISWGIMVNNNGAHELSAQPYGSNYTIRDTYVEDTLSGEFNSININGVIRTPVDLVEGKPSNASSNYSLISKFTRIYQNVGESYSAFKNRLQPLEYGVYVDDSGIQTVVIYFGRMGDNGLKYSDVDSNFINTAVNRAINTNGYYDESDRTELTDYYTQVYGNGNVIAGNVTSYVIYINEKYDKVLTDTSKSNTAIITYDGTEKNVTGKGTLQGMLGSGSNSVATGVAKVYLSDKDTGTLLDGVSYKLQVKQGDGSWIDYTGWSGGTTDADGSVETGILGPGTYRFVQTSAYSTDYDMPNSDGYDSGEGYPISNEFTVTVSDTTGHLVTMTNVKYKYTVKYEPGTQGNFSTITKSNVVINSTTPAYDGVVGVDGNPAANAGYTFAGWTPTVAGKVTADATYVAQWVPLTNTGYKVEHYLQQADGSYSLADTDALVGSTGATVTGVAKTTYDGYYFDGSIIGTVQSGVILGDGSLTLKLYYNARSNVVYKVEHHLQQADGSYTLKDTDSFTGTTGHTVTAVAKTTYAGYTFDNSVSGTKESGVVKGDGSLVLKLYYKANTNTSYKVEHYLEQADGSYALEDTDNLTGTTGALVTATPKTTYAGYTVNILHTESVQFGTIKGDGTLTLKLYYSANSNTAYKVEHYLEQTDGSYTLADTDNLSGKTGTTVTGTPKTTYTGYAYDGTVVGTVASGVVAGDGSLVLKLHYKANTNTAYKVEHYLQQANGSYTLEDTDNLTGVTGATVTGTAKTTYAGYTFDNSVSGTKESGVIAGNGSLVLKLYYTADTDTGYKVEHYLQQADGSYTLADTDNLSGTTGTVVTATPKTTYAGYTINILHVGSIQVGTIKGDGSLTLKLYYAANTNTAYKVEHYLQQEDGSYALADTDNLIGTTGVTVSGTPKTTYTGYTYDSTVIGSLTSGTVAGDGSLVLKLHYKANTGTVYQVEHYLQQADGSYTLADTEAKSGTTGSNVTAISKSYTGYTFDNTVSGTKETGVVLGNGSLVLKLYYTADTDTDYKVEHYLQQTDGSYALTDTDNLTGTTGSTVTAVSKTTYAGYTFNNTIGGTVESGVVLGNGSLVLKLYYTADTDTGYKVEHYLQQADGSYALADTDNLTGTTGFNVTAVSKTTYTGYTFDSTVSGTVESGTILGNGSLVLKLYYTANTDTAYKVEHYLEQADGSYVLADTDNLTGTTGATVTGVSKTTYVGYTFDNTISGTVESGTVVGDGSLVLKLYYAANTDTAYKVVHYLEKQDGSEAIFETENFTGKTGATVFAFPKMYEGYEVDTANSVARNFFLTGVVKADGSLVFEIHYKLTRHSVTYTSGTHGTFTDVVYGNLAYGSDTPSYGGTPVGEMGYEFTGWSPKVTNTVTEDTVYEAQWKASTNTVYKVEHYLEQSNGNYKLADNETLNATTDTEVTAIPKTYTGYTFDSNVTGTVLKGNVSGDGSLVLKVYYKRNSQSIITKPSVYPEDKSGAGVSTNDSTNLVMLYGMLSLSLLGLITIAIKKRRQAE